MPVTKNNSKIILVDAENVSKKIDDLQKFLTESKNQAKPY